MRVLLATGIEELDKILAAGLTKAGVEIAGECYIREYVVDMAEQKEADAVVLGPHLDGECELIEKVVFPLRLADKRVVLLPGSKSDPAAVELGLRAVACGVYDMLFDPVDAGGLIKKLGNPGTMAGALKDLGVSDAEVRQIAAEAQKLVSPENNNVCFKEKEIVGDLERNTEAGKHKKVWKKLLANAFSGWGANRSANTRKAKKQHPACKIRNSTQDELGTQCPSAKPHFYVYGKIQTDAARVSCFTSIEEIEKAVEVEEPTSIVLPAFSGAVDIVKHLRRKVKFASIPIAVIGRFGGCDSATIFEAGADEQADELTPEVIERLVARKKRLETLWDRAVRDDLTGLYKRSFMEECLREALESYQNNNVPVAFLICDLDHFKQVNDTYGHQAGDAVLKEFAHFLRLFVRETDIVARYGGEEFAIVFPRTEGEIARTVAQRLCEAWAEHEIDLGGQKVASTFSAGLAVPAPGMASEDLIKAADRALYRAKEAGRNRVVAAWDKAVPVDMPVSPAGAQAVPAVRTGTVLNNAAPVETPARAETPRLSVLATPSPVQEVPLPVPQSLPKLQPPPTARRTGGFSFVPMENMVVLYGVTPGADVAGTTAKISRSLQKARCKVALVEANFSNPGLALRLGIPGEELWDRDWRIGGVGAGGIWQGIAAWLLDPWVKEVPPDGELRSLLLDILHAAVELKSRWIIVESDYDFPYFDAFSRAAGHTLAVVRPGERLPLYGDFPGILVKDREGSTEYPAYEIYQIVSMLKNRPKNRPKNRKEMLAN